MPDGNDKIHWDDETILKRAGGNPEAVRNLLAKYQQPVPTVAAIYQWASRRQITRGWRAPLIYCLLSEGQLKMAELFRLGDPRRSASQS